MRFLPRCWGLGGASRDEEADDADWGVVAAGVVDTVSKAVQHHVGGAGCTIGVDKVEGLALSGEGMLDVRRGMLGVVRMRPPSTATPPSSESCTSSFYWLPHEVGSCEAGTSALTAQGEHSTQHALADALFKTRTVQHLGPQPVDVQRVGCMCKALPIGSPASVGFTNKRLNCPIPSSPTLLNSALGALPPGWPPGTDATRGDHGEATRAGQGSVECTGQGEAACTGHAIHAPAVHPEVIDAIAKSYDCDRSATVERRYCSLSADTCAWAPLTTACERPLLLHHWRSSDPWTRQSLGASTGRMRYTAGTLVK
eukprot:CAMPEP_0181257520 /NCGR_PEP_ID=MMETSP1096-20121128/50289_1 /TAXON_ID=156174 ORGANISM="Chrysochromulina ericina, Strain CCMP281" /NCGR_SAMPLE_ID=MMETSP1096 /ASSEMBLY_ACC=CAM_ASM_000453 /LENGTH=311 /DNA_ID=CAMNT_0023355845 /DNA_START=170 /DNA_END=1102 /DNA_ORIENTATION=-